MTVRISDFSAIAPTLGYLYQIRYALLNLMDMDEDGSIILERLDDIEIRKDSGIIELLQLKHHTRQASLTNSSPDLWKTLRIWSTHYLDKRISVEFVRLNLVTTASASPESIAALLKQDTRRDPKKAATELTEIAKTSTNEALTDSYAAFLKLTFDERAHLVNRIYIHDSAVDITRVEDRMKKSLQFSARPHHINKLLERVEGWWLLRIIRSLTNDSARLISRIELQTKIIELSEQFTADALPIDFLNAIMPDSQAANFWEKTFVQQLKAISVGNTRIKKAMDDYYRAFEQRSRWLREDLLIDQELEEYEKVLVDEWQRRAETIKEGLLVDVPEEAELIDAGRRVYNWIDQEAEFKIRPNVTAAYVMRGSYQILADRLPPDVWWHPQFLHKLKVNSGTDS